MDAKDEVKAKMDIADVVGEYVTLKPAGSGSLKGLCPFHNERTPSFNVSRERQIYKCFGCDKSGDIFNFLMEMEGLTFIEALKELANRAGIILPEYKKPEGSDRKEEMLRIQDVAAKFYEKMYTDDPRGSAVRSYVAGRKIAEKERAKFRLGAAPAEWDALALFLKSKGFSEAAMVDSGLCMRRKSGSGVFDRFRNRLMVPLCDPAGHVVGFTARVLPGSTEEEGPKYMNSPETLIYKKSDVLFGLHVAKQGIRHASEVIIVEGNLDVIASHAAGIENIVASSGTALTESQLRTLARYTKRLVFCLDDDAAGFAAAKRVLELAMEMQRSDASLRFAVRCLSIPAGMGKDPDEVVQKDPELWRTLAANSEEIIEYYFVKTLRMFEAKGSNLPAEDRRTLIDELLPQIARLERPDDRHLYLLRLSDATRIEKSVLEGMLQERQVKTAPTSPTAVKKPAFLPLPKKASQKESAAIFLLGVAANRDEYAEQILASIPEGILSEPWALLYDALRGMYTQPETQPSPTPPQTLFSRLRAYLDETGNDRLVKALDALTLRTDEIIAGLPQAAVAAEVDRHLALVKGANVQAQKKALEADIRAAELSGDTEKLAQLLRTYQEIAKM